MCFASFSISCIFVNVTRSNVSTRSRPALPPELNNTCEVSSIVTETPLDILDAICLFESTTCSSWASNSNRVSSSTQSTRPLSAPRRRLSRIPRGVSFIQSLTRKFSVGVVQDLSRPSEGLDVLPSSKYSTSKMSAAHFLSAATQSVMQLHQRGHAVVVQASPTSLRVLTGSSRTSVLLKLYICKLSAARSLSSFQMPLCLGKHSEKWVGERHYHWDCHLRQPRQSHHRHHLQEDPAGPGSVVTTSRSRARSVAIDRTVSSATNVSIADTDVYQSQSSKLKQMVK